jgi:hypothetical protein
MGLALGIDYSLFVLSRYREERQAGRDKIAAIIATGGTSSKAVLFSGSSFVVALLGLLLVPDTILRSLALGAILVGIVSVCAALTLLPAVLSILGDLSTFRVLPDRIQQAMLNFLFLGRAAKAPDGFGSNPAFQNPDGTSRLAPTIYYAGNSQGGIIGGALTAVAQDWQRAFLGVPGMNYSTLLNRSVDFDDFNPFFIGPYPDELTYQLNLSLIQMLWDRGENDGYANHLTSDPLPGTQPHQQFRLAGQGHRDRRGGRRPGQAAGGAPTHRAVRAVRGGRRVPDRLREPRHDRPAVPPGGQALPRAGP